MNRVLSLNDHLNGVSNSEGTANVNNPRLDNFFNILNRGLDTYSRIREAREHPERIPEVPSGAGVVTQSDVNNEVKDFPRSSVVRPRFSNMQIGLGVAGLVLAFYIIKKI